MKITIHTIAQIALGAAVWPMAAASMEEPLKVAVIGAGFLGARIISEMLLLGNQVAPWMDSV